MNLKGGEPCTRAIAIEAIRDEGLQNSLRLGASTHDILVVGNKKRFLVLK